MNKMYLKLIVALAFDAIIADVSIMFSAWLVGDKILFLDNSVLLFSLSILPLLIVVSYYIFRIYNILWQYSRYSELARVCFASFLGVGCFYVVQMAIFSKSFKVSVYLVTLLLICFLVSAERLLLKGFYINNDKSKDTKKRAI